MPSFSKRAPVLLNVLSSLSLVNLPIAAKIKSIAFPHSIVELC